METKIKCEQPWLSNREWIFVIILVILSQFLLHQYASNMMNETQVINYISFSGTIVSIILAILAIVYSFFQSMTQQGNSDKIANSVESLTTVASTVNQSVDTMIVQANILNSVVDDVRNLPSDIVSLVSETLEQLNKKHVVDIREAFLEYVDRVKPDKDNNSHKNNEMNSGTVTKGNLRNAKVSHNARWSIITTTILSCVLINRLSVFEVLKDIVKGSGGNKDFIDELTILFTGAVSELAILKSLNIIVEDEDKEGVENNYYYVSSDSKYNDVRMKLFSVIFVYYRDACDDINKKLGEAMGKVLIDALKLTPESKDINADDIVKRVVRD